jgi:surface antigen
LRPLLFRVAAVLTIGIAAIACTISISTPAAASATDCFSYAYACTPGYAADNASGTWAWSHYGDVPGNDITTQTGDHNCTLYVAWRPWQSGMTNDPGNWGNASNSANAIGGDHTSAAGSIAWYAGTASNPAGHVAYVEQVSGSNVFIRADNFSYTSGYTDAGWVSISSVGLFSTRTTSKTPAEPTRWRFKPTLVSCGRWDLICTAAAVSATHAQAWRHNIAASLATIIVVN